MRVEVQLNESEQLLLWMLGQVKEIKFSGLSVLDSFLDYDGNIVQRIFASSLSSYIEKRPFLHEMAYQKHVETNFILREELSRKRTKREKEFESRVAVLERLDLIELFEEEKGGLIGSNPEKWVRVTPEGMSLVERIEERRLLIIRPRESKRTTVFIASAFGHDDTDELFQNVFLPVCERLDYKATRIDLTEPDGTISDAILEAIRVAECIIADLTYARPSVYFEIGFAKGLGEDLLLTCRDDHLNGFNDNTRVHFDIEQYKISFWHRSAKGVFEWADKMDPYTRLSNKLGEKLDKRS